jgi:hypothetical protein
MKISVETHVFASAFTVNAYGKTYTLWHGVTYGEYLPARDEEGNNVFVKLAYVPDSDGDTYSFEVFAESEIVHLGYEETLDIKLVKRFKSEEVIDLQNNIDRLVNTPWQEYQEYKRNTTLEERMRREREILTDRDDKVRGY